MTDVRTIRIVGLADGVPTAFDGQWIVEYDPSRDGVDPGGRPMRCHLVTTPNRDEAKEYTGLGAIEVWRAVDTREPVRPDGRPNRPLSAFTVEIA